MALFHVDSSALVKLVRDEPESPGLRAFLAEADLVSCELVLTEIPRAIRRAVGDDPRLDPDTLLTRTGDLVEAVALLPLDRALLLGSQSALGQCSRRDWTQSTLPRRLTSDPSMAS